MGEAAVQSCSLIIARSKLTKEASMYAGIRQVKAKPGVADMLARRIKEGVIARISSVPGFRA